MHNDRDVSMERHCVSGTSFSGHIVAGRPISPTIGCKKKDGVLGRPETMCPRTNFLGPLVPEMNRPRNIMSLR